jgi:hypothetical protein
MLFQIPRPFLGLRRRRGAQALARPTPAPRAPPATAASRPRSDGRWRGCRPGILPARPRPAASQAPMPPTRSAIWAKPWRRITLAPIEER